MSYGLKYTIPFQDSEVSCVINIEVKDFVGTPTELIAGATPIRIDTDTADVLTPIRSSSATIEVFGLDLPAGHHTRSAGHQGTIIRTACYNGLDMSSRRRSAKTSQISSPTRSSACLLYPR